MTRILLFKLFGPFHNPSVGTNTQRAQPGNNRFKFFSEFFVLAKYFRSCNCVVHQLAGNGHIHSWPHGYVRNLTIRGDKLIFGRARWPGHQITCLGVFCKVIDKKQRSLFQYWIVLFQKFFIASEQIMLPNMLAAPCGTHWPHSPLGFAFRSSPIPNISVVMGHKSPAIIHFLSCFAATGP